ncbi:MAG: tRNA 2-thiocytidine biosynthesis TtcA family protein [Sphaerochaetaceae bacterium]|jgi:tRNA 2-thiocytidine biosynthesis protein TtcA
MDERLDYHRLLDGDIPPWVMRFIKTTGKAINQQQMIQGGDSILLSVSGGKDSLALALALSVRRKWLPIDYRLSALMINWIEHPIPPESRAPLAEYFGALDIDFIIIDENQFSPSFDGEFNCYLCARNRRRILFSYCDEHGIRKVAMGHHLDDLVETSLINTCFRGRFETMRPVQSFFDGKLFIIRPMILIHESTTKRLATAYSIPVIKPVCPYDQTNVRARLKPIVSDLAKIDKLTREHIYHAHGFSDTIKSKCVD